MSSPRNRPDPWYTYAAMRKLPIANRGEIAARIIRPVAERSIATVAVFSQGRRRSAATRC
jgi:acetyl/propionyl-CoA carboxylase alpha subunit